MKKNTSTGCLGRWAAVWALILGMVGAIQATVGWGAESVSEFKLPKDTPNWKAGPGVELVRLHCVLCHSSDYISTQPRLNSVQWRGIVTKMRDRYGAPIPTNRVDELTLYLTTAYGAPAVK